MLFQVHLKKIAKQKHHKSRRMQLLLDEGRIASHLTDTFPECKPAEYKRPYKAAAE
jgi:hypothetical protein